MKKVLGVLFTFVLVLALFTACGSKDNSSSTSSTTTTTAATTTTTAAAE